MTSLEDHLENLNLLLSNYLNARKENIEALFIFDRLGKLFANKYHDDLTPQKKEKIQNILDTFVKSTLEEISSMRAGKYGSKTFEIDGFHLAFIEASSHSIFLSFYNSQTKLKYKLFSI